MYDFSFRTHRLAGQEYGDLNDRREDARRGVVYGFLVMETELVEGEVVLSKNFFHNLDGIALLDTLGDWIGLLQREYDKVHGEVYAK